MARHRVSSVTFAMYDNRRIIRVTVIAALAIVLAATVWFFYSRMHKQSNVEQIAYIRSWCGPGGVLNDYQGKVGMKDPSQDIRWFIKGNNIELDFGYMTMEWSKKDFLSPENILNLGSIGLEVQYDEINDVIRVFYLGEEIQQWVK